MVIVRVSFYSTVSVGPTHQFKSVGSIRITLGGEGLAHLFRSKNINLPKVETWFLNTDFLHGCIYCVYFLFIDLVDTTE
jgi:hypothetical protein